MTNREKWQALHAQRKRLTERVVALKAERAAHADATATAIADGGDIPESWQGAAAVGDSNIEAMELGITAVDRELHFLKHAVNLQVVKLDKQEPLRRAANALIQQRLQMVAALLDALRRGQEVPTRFTIELDALSEEIAAILAEREANRAAIDETRIAA